MGTISFSEPLSERNSDVIIDLYGLEANTRYEVKVHEFGNVEDQCKNIGDIFSPDNDIRGFLGRFRTDGKGRGYKELADRKVMITNPFSIIGRSCSV